jgi:hypothetical protein
MNLIGYDAEEEAKPEPEQEDMLNLFDNQPPKQPDSFGFIQQN